ncbi:hypothetical protein LTR41_011894 [Exophiala xenobiotica]|nr:hypothetical protein LTR41_011894 [Exophiala xenobiotica]
MEQEVLSPDGSTSSSPVEPVGQGPPEQEQVVPETESENIEREKQAEDFGEMQEADDNIQNSNDDHNVRGDTQGEEEHHDKEEGKKSNDNSFAIGCDSHTRVIESSTDHSSWKDWDMRRERKTPDDLQTTAAIKAVRVWDRFCQRSGPVSTSSEYPQRVNLHRVDILVTILLAVGNSHGFGALKRAMIGIQQGGAPSIADAFSNEPQRLVRTLTAIDTAGDMYAYLRRFALARLAKLYRSTAANAGQLTTDDDDDAAWMSRRRPACKDDKAKAYRSMIEHIRGTAFPDRFRGQTMTKSGLIDSDAPEAVRWNQCKRKLSKQIEIGQRWLQWAERLGWSSLSLISRDWSIGDSKVVASDRTFEEILSVSEHTMLLNAVETEKGRFLRQVDHALGGSLFELLKDTNRVQHLPLLKLDDEEIMARSDCDSRWVAELTCQQPVP